MSQTPETPSLIESRPKYAAMGCILAAGSMWGCIGLFNRSLSAMHISAASIVLLRNVGACLVLAILFLCIDRKIFRIRLRHIPYFLGTGIVSILFFTLCYFRSQQISSLAVSAILLYTAPTFVVIFSAILWKDTLTKRKLLALVLAFLGCLSVTGIASGGISLSREGLLVGLGSGFFYGMYTIFGRYALQYYGPFTVTFYTFLVAGLGSCFLVRPTELHTVLQSPKALLLVAGIMIFATVLPYLLYTRGLNELQDGGKASILASIEPVVASVVGIVAFGEPLTIGVFLGLACILLSVYTLR